MIDPLEVGHDLLPTDCVAPQYILQGLHAINRHATLLYVGGGRWWLGVVVPDSESADGGAARRQSGRELLATEEARPPELRSYWRTVRGKLLIRGFRYIHTFRGAPTGRIVEWMREAEYNYQHHLDERLAESQALTDGTRNRQRAEQGARRHARDNSGAVWREFFKKPFTIAVNGFRGVRDRLTASA